MKHFPMVSVKENGNEKFLDIFSCLLKNRIIMMDGPVDSVSASLVNSQILFLDSQDTTPIHIYINSEGGSVYDLMSMLNSIGSIKAPVYTYCLGLCASAAAVLFAAGIKRYVLKFSRLMLHQPHGNARGQATDISIQSKEINYVKKTINEFIAKRTGLTPKKVSLITNRDSYFSAEEAVKLGFATDLIECYKT
jgi:ATP-dependent Clp protease protease subunit